MKRIRFRRDLEICRTKLRDLREQLATLRKGLDKVAFDETTDGLQHLCHEMAETVELYEKAEQDQLPPVIHARNARTGRLEVGKTLLLLRQAAHLDQYELADRLKTDQSSISRWESDGYDRYNLRNLTKIADTLGYEVAISFVRKGSSTNEESRKREGGHVSRAATGRARRTKSIDED